MPPRRARDPEAAADAARATKRVREFADLLPEAPGYAFVVGNNSFGGLGLGEAEMELQRPKAVQVGDGLSLFGAVCGGMHTAALASDGSVWTWGVNDEGALGRPTEGTAWSELKASDALRGDCYTPGRVELPAGVFVVQVVAGDGFTMALTDEGAIYGWGQFKDDLSSFAGFSPSSPIQRLPALVYAADDARDRVRQLAAGGRHMVALTRRGEVLTWGIGGVGQLGRIAPYAGSHAAPPSSVLLTPTAVPGVAAAIGSDVTAIGAGMYSSFAINRRGAVAAWGLNNGGQLGLPLAAQDASQNHWAPAAVPALAKGIAAMAGGEHHTLALTRKHQVLSFGKTTYGALGREGVPQPTEKEDVLAPTPTPVDATDGLGDEQPLSIAAGMAVSACVTAGGNAYLWGSNTSNQMAKGADDEDNLVPTRMRRTKTFGNRRVLSWSFGGQHAVLLATAEQGEALTSPPPEAPPAAAAARGAGSSAATAAAAGSSAAAAAAPAGSKRGRKAEPPGGSKAKAPAAKRKRSG